MSKACYRALEYLQSCISEASRTGSTRLPPITMLACAAGVAPRTMWKAVSVLKERGDLTVRPRRGICIVNANTSLPETPVRSHEPALERIAGQIVSKVLAPLPPDAAALPSIKQMERLLGCNYRTVKKALCKLESRGVIGLRGHHYIPSYAHILRTANPVVLHLRGTDQGNVYFPSVRSRDLFFELETMCTGRNLRLVVHPVKPLDSINDFLEHRATTYRSFSSVPPCGVLGHIVWSAGMDRQEYRPLLDRLRDTGAPVVLLNESGIPTVGSLHDQTGLYCIDWIDNVGAASAIARYCERKGRRRIAFISPLHGAGWSQVRADTLAAQCKKEGRRLNTYVNTGFARFHTAVSRSIDQLAAVRAQLAGLQGGAAQSSLTSMVFASMARQADQTFESCVARLMTFPLCEEALNCGDADTWVCANDEIACLVCEYLSDHGLQPGKEIGVIGFDNIKESSIYGITTYDFNRSGLLAMMLSGILEPEVFLRRPQMPEGMIVERRTC
jgi:DNA-binding LacI/PurR family transcriptional regulator/DNA-binding transcriptional regulator YhcF (GntR family)